MAFNPSRIPSVLRLSAPAKINLHLRVGPPTDDGFHPLLTWMCTVSLFDTLEFSPIESGSASSAAITLRCDDPSLPCDATNLIVRAGGLLAQAIDEQRCLASTTREGGDAFERTERLPRGNEGETVLGRRDGVSMTLQKRIPTGAGLGGGSSDGAAAMLGLSRFWGVDLGANRLAELSAQCGSDLPFFFHSPSSICTGRGQFVQPVPVPIARWGVLVLPSIAMPTPAVYRKFDEMRLGRSDDLANPPDWKEWAMLAAENLLPRLVNDLEAPAFALCPELGKLRAAIETQLARPVRMSGSGSSLFTLFDTETAAESAAQQVTAVQGVVAKCVQIAPEI